MHKVSAQVRNVFEKCLRMTDGDVFEQDQMLMDLSHVANVRNHGHAVPLREEAYCQKLAHSPKSSAIGLQEADTTCLKVVLKDNSIRDVFAESKGYGRYCIGDLFVREDVVGMRRLFNPMRIHTR